MAVTTDAQALSTEQIIALSKRHTLFEWSAFDVIDRGLALAGRHVTV